MTYPECPTIEPTTFHPTRSCPELEPTTTPPLILTTTPAKRRVGQRKNPDAPQVPHEPQKTRRAFAGLMAGEQPREAETGETQLPARVHRTMHRDVAKSGAAETVLLRTGRSMLLRALKALDGRWQGGPDALPKLTIREDRALRFLHKVVKDFRYDHPETGPVTPVIDLTKFDADTIRMYFLEAKKAQP